MRIGFFSESYKPYVSGVVKSIESFTEELNKKGHEVFIFAPDYPRVEEEAESNIFRIKSLPAPTHPEFRLPLPLAPAWKKKAAALNLDIIHTHSPFIMGWLAKSTAKKLDLPLIFTYHTLYEKYSHYVPLVQKLVQKATLKYTRKYCDYCELIIAPSDYVKKRLRQQQVSTPILTIPTGIDISLYENRDPSWIRKEYSLNQEDNLLLFVGRLGREKNIDFLLQAFSEILNNINHTKLMIVGEGPYKENLIQLSRELGLQQEVIFTGLQPHARVIDFYLDSDLFVFPSLTETQGLVILEAMAGNLPVVAVDAAGATGVVEEGVNGLLVGKDEYDFAQAVIQLLTHEKRYNLFKKKAYRKAQEYTIEKMSERLIQGYQKIISGSRME